MQEPEGTDREMAPTTYDISIEHRAGKQHRGADALLRRPCIVDAPKHCQRAESKEGLQLEKYCTTKVLSDKDG